LGRATENVTIVVATRNRRAQLLSTLPMHEARVIVVDNGSTDDTAPAVRREHPEMRLIRVDSNIGAAARNIGAKLAVTPYVAFADDDSYWDTGALSRASTILDAHPRAALLTANVTVGDDRTDDPVTAIMAAAPIGWERDLPGPSVLGFLACAAVVRRDAFLDAGGFNPRLHFGGEEALLAMDLAAAGWGLAYVPSLVVRHMPSPEGRQPATRRRQEARSHLLTTWLRRPARIGLREAGRAMTTPERRAGLRDALADLAWVLRHRRPLPASVEAALLTLERHPTSTR
jgi:GT2 family glycosyltransferase